MSTLIRRKPRKLVIKRGSLYRADELAAPYAEIDALDSGAHKLRHVIAIALALAAHGAFGLAALLQHTDNDHPPPPPPHREIVASIAHAPPPPPPAPPPPPPPPKQTAPRPVARTAPQAPPPPAQAGKAIAVDGPADLTSFDLVVGQGTSYAGGISAANGTNKTAVHEVAQAGAPPRREAPANDCARAATPVRRDWVCPWPDSEQDSDLRDAHVIERIHITRDGDASQVDVITAPSSSFADAARRCALDEHYHPAIDKTCSATESASLYNIRFSR